MLKHDQVFIGTKVKLTSFDDVSEKGDFSERDGLVIGGIYEVERLGSNGFIQLKGQQGYFHSTNKFDLYILEDPPINIQWDGKCFEIDGIKVDPIVLKEILALYKFDDNGQAIVIFGH
jgi:hypothetical protein